MIDASMVFGVIALSSSSGLTNPSLSTSRYVASKPWGWSHLQVLSTQSCSVLDMIMWLPLSLLVKAIDLRAMLFDSVPPEVKIISSGDAPIDLAITFLAHSIAFLASLPLE